MSRLVQLYLRDIENIKNTYDFESDTYSNALLIEKTFNDLLIEGYISDFEKNVVIGISSGYNYSELARKLNCGRRKISVTFAEVCNRIAFVLGYAFTDIGLLEEHLPELDRYKHLNIETYFKDRLRRLSDYDIEMYS